MTHDLTMTRTGFLKTCGSLAAGALFGRRSSAADPTASDAIGPVRLKSWEVIQRPARKEHFRHFIRIRADNGALGYCRALGGVQNIRAAEQAVAGVNLLDHEKLYDLMVSKHVPERQRKVLDIACWDLHARMADKPLHVLLGTRKKKILRYGDVRWKGSDITPTCFAGWKPAR